MHSTLSIRGFPNVAFETVPVFVWLTMALSRPFKEDRLALPLSTPLSSRRSMMPLALCPHVRVSSSSTLQATCDWCFARHLSDRSFAFTPACQGKYTVPLFTDIDECVSAPCQNGGTCTDHVNSYLCQCAPGYSGLQCQTGKVTVTLKHVQDPTYLKCSYNYLKANFLPVWFLSWRVEFSLIIWVVVLICHQHQNFLFSVECKGTSCLKRVCSTG